ncbi:hypothetical protein SAMN05660477_03173 [Soonwooa buanensis]|uniref:Uncharacterized protein n=1 Tax=Soonwooa buanensis TaxID=619805 RepID=A0A1T5GWE1_9FLAO|nr:hypothetical protein [Soonwooa buanensis]SKC12743.1 hypothetical protein SAMN05660477_03173 [Soonwooa buanensis]
MSEHSITVVPRQSSYPDNKIKAKEILDWLTSQDIVKPTLSDCILSSDNGYAISDGARQVTNIPDELPFDLITNGLEIITNRQVFHTGENGMEECICPNCKENIASEDWSFFNDWDEQKSNNLTCPLCNVATDIHKFTFSPDWGFSDLGFTFWNWSDLTDEFISEFRQKLGCDISIVYTHI